MSPRLVVASSSEVNSIAFLCGMLFDLLLNLGLGLLVGLAGEALVSSRAFMLKLIFPSLISNTFASTSCPSFTISLGDFTNLLESWEI